MCSNYKLNLIFGCAGKILARKDEEQLKTKFFEFVGVFNAEFS
jgi:hypothetical protein